MSYNTTNTIHPYILSTFEKNTNSTGLLYTKFRIKIHIIRGTPTELWQVTPADNSSS